MQAVVVDKPYRFVPPHEGDLWPRLLGCMVPAYLRRVFGVIGLEFRGVERLRASRTAGHGIVLTPNHCRPCDPFVLGALAAQMGQPIFTMASSHLFAQSRAQTWLLRHGGAFSVYREGLDRDALKCAIRILAEARRPLVLFPEGVVSRSNDRLVPLMDGVAFIARNAARQRAALPQPGKVVMHPVALRYFYGGDVRQALPPVLTEIERRLTWRPQQALPLVDRVVKLGDALLTLKEIEYFGEGRIGAFAPRIQALLDHILVPMEAAWTGGTKESGVTARVKALRTAILPDLVEGDLGEPERAARWRLLEDLYLAQQLAFYPPDYFSRPDPEPEQLLETVERFEEDLTDKARIYAPMHCAVEVGEAIEVPAGREKSAGGDPVINTLRTQLEAMLQALKQRRPPR